MKRARRVRKHIDKLRHEVTRLDEAVEALLRFMRPEQLKLSDFDMNELLKELGGRVNPEKTQSRVPTRSSAAFGSSRSRIDLRSALQLDNQRRASDAGRWRV